MNKRGSVVLYIGVILVAALLLCIGILGSYASYRFYLSFRGSGGMISIQDLICNAILLPLLSFSLLISSAGILGLRNWARKLSLLALLILSIMVNVMLFLKASILGLDNFAVISVGIVFISTICLYILIAIFFTRARVKDYFRKENRSAKVPSARAMKSSQMGSLFIGRLLVSFYHRYSLPARLRQSPTARRESNPDCRASPL